jgi:PKD repeat protein
MKKTILVSLLLLTSSLSLFAQGPNQPTLRKPSEAKNNEDLISIFKQNNEIKKSLIQQKLNGQAARTLTNNGGVIEAVGITQNGLILYNTTFNLGAAKTISTDKLWTGGSLGLSLSGQGLTNRLGVWDGSGVLSGHQEFQGRATVPDGSAASVEHATHVAGTMVAFGINANAKGGAFQAPIKSYDWTNDEGEMTSAAAAGMLISNHSYGLICGWYFNSSNNRNEWYGDYALSQAEDNKYGLYSSEAEGWDQICYSNPFYLPFKAAGNDRGDNSSSSTWYYRNTSGSWVQGPSNSKPPADGPYDCISDKGVAKNVITIGAVNKIGGSNNNNGWTKPSDVVMSSFSGWGPTDDGRIKPDVVACGVDVFSTSNSSSTGYTTMSGTSMATPNASGSALLIQQYYNNRKGNFMKASSLKGLIIHTADEAGNAGPDYTYGWGLMNTVKAVQHLQDSTNNMLVQSNLNSGSSYTYSFVSDGTKPIRATICWTDVPGTGIDGLLDPTALKLVNDLDIRLKRVSDNTIFQPYIMNPATPNAAATTGDNFRDNIEQIYLSAPQAGTYVLVVSHKGALTNNTQDFSLILSGRTTKPGAALNVASRTLCSGQAVTFNDISAGATNRKWYFPGGNPSTSTLASPVVTYTNAGSYPVSLVVSNISGTDSVFYNNYMIVGGMGLPLIENFEQNSTTVGLWSVQNPGNDSTWRLFNVAGNNPGNFAAGINNYDNPTTLSDYLLTPVLNFAGYQTAQLSFQHAYSPYYSNPDFYADSLVVAISTNCGNTWTRLLAKGEDGTINFATVPANSFSAAKMFVPSKTADWCGGGVGPACYSINLNSFVGLNNVKIRFEQIGGGGNNMYIDNIAITGVPFKPVANFTIPQGKICTGASFTILDSSKNVPSSWQWKISGVNLTSGDQNPSFVINQPGTYDVSLRISNATGADSITKTSVLVVEQAPATPSITSNRATSVLCSANDSFALNTTATGNLLWYKNNQSFGSSASNSINVNQIGDYTLKILSPNGCAAVSNKISVNLSSYPPKPSITRSLSSNVFCDGVNFTLTSSASKNNQWTRNGSDISGQTLSSLITGDSGVFAVKVDNAGCIISSDTLIMVKLPKPSTSDISGNGTANRNTKVTYSVTGTPGSSFQWNVTSGTISSGQGTNQIEVLWSASASSGSLNVVETGSNACIGPQKTKNIGLFNTSVNEVIKGITEMDIYPIPAYDKLNLKLELTGEQYINYRVYDVLGKVIFQKSIKASGTITEVINTASYLSGIYFVEVSNEIGKASKRFIKE